MNTKVSSESSLAVTAHKIQTCEAPLKFVLGYTCVNDVTARDLQRKDVQFTRGKSFNTFCPVGPVIVSDIDPLNVSVITRLNGEVKQQGNTSDMAFSVPFLIKYIADIMTLNPGDLIATGTPAGVSRMRPGDVVEVEVGGIGVLRNPIQPFVMYSCRRRSIMKFFLDTCKFKGARRPPLESRGRTTNHR